MTTQICRSVLCEERYPASLSISWQINLSFPIYIFLTKNDDVGVLMSRAVRVLTFV
jgi:hypothetical protein